MPAANDVVWLSVLPDMKGFGSALTKKAGAQSAVAGKAAGAGFGKAALAGVAVVATGAVLATKALYNIGATFDDMADTIRVGTGATGKTLDGLVASAKKVGKDVPASFGDISTAIADLNTRTGQSGPGLEALTKQMLELTRLTGGDLSGNIAAITRVFGDWGIAVEDQSATMDYLFKVSQSTGIGIDSLSEKVVSFGAPLRQLGFSFKESAALLGKWEKEGVNTNAVLAGMKIGLGTLSKAGKEPVQALKDVQAAIAGAGSSGEANAIAIETFGQRAGPDMAAAIREGRFDLDELMATLEGSSETIMGAADDTADFSEQWIIFKNKALILIEPVATRVFNALGKGMDWITTTGVPALKSLNKWMGNNRTTMTALTVVVAAGTIAFLGYSLALRVTAGVQRMFTIATVFGTAAQLLWTTAVTLAGKACLGTRIQLIALTVAQWSLNVAMSMNPIVLVVAALVLLVGGVILAYKKVDWFRKGIDKLWAGIKIGFGWVKKNWPLLLAILTGPFGIAVYIIVKKWGAIRSALSSGWNWMKSNVFNPLTSVIRDKIPGAFRSGAKAIGSAWDSIKNLAKKPVNFVIDTVYNNGLRKGFNSVAGFLKLKTRLPAMKSIGGGGGAGGTGLHAPHSRSPQSAMGGPGDWIKKIAGKGWDWAQGKMMSPVNAALGKIGSSPFAQMAGAAGKKLAGGAASWLKSKFMASDFAAGPMGKAGRVLRKGSYSIGMPYLGYPGHYGADYPASSGTPVYSPFSGKVSRAMTLAGSYGKHVFIGHSGGIQTRYAHLSGYNVRAGQSVEAGQQIGRVGTTGNSTGNHLHFEYRKNGRAINPAGLGIFDKGGWMQPGMGGVNLSRKPEPVFSDAQWSTLKRVTHPILTGDYFGDTARGREASKTLIYNASDGPSLSSEERLFKAAASARFEF